MTRVIIIKVDWFSKVIDRGLGGAWDYRIDITTSFLHPGPTA